MKGLYEGLRIKLLDLSKRNRMLNYPLGARSRRHIQIVNVTLDGAYSELLDGGASLKIAFLQEPEGTPQDEKTQEFMDAFEHAKVSDVEYLSALEGLINTGRDDEIAIERLERNLRDRVRSTLGLAPRLKRAEINRAEHARSLGIDPNPELKATGSKPSDKGKALQTLKYPDELEALMEKLLDEARLAEQEAGLSTLFLAFGFLEWYENDASDKPLYAPLALLPVKLERRTIRGKDVYFVAAREEGAETNVSLRKLLEKDFNCTLPEIEADDTEEIGSIEGYHAKVRESVRGLKRWNVRRWLVLGHFAFSRIVMYEDTKPQKWSIHPVETELVGSLLKGYEQADEVAAGSFVAPEDYPIDQPEIERLAPILVQDADASQHSALVDVMKSKNLVLHGPPGTGKSQTISNIIANVIARGKTVLFLSEKQAALDVVKRRLDIAGLGDFCLEVHSDKSSPKTVIRSLDRRYQLGTGKATKGFDGQADATWQFARKQITDYVEALHAEAGDGWTPFKLIWKSIRDRTIYADIMGILKTIDIPTRVLDNIGEVKFIRGRLEIFARSAQSFSDNHGHWSLSPWGLTPPGNAPAYVHEEMLDAISNLRRTTADLADFLDSQKALGIVTASDADQVVAADANLPEPPDMRAVAAIAAIDLDGLDRALALQTALLDASAALAALPPPDVDATILSRASRLKSLLPRPELSDLAPSELYQTLQRTIERSRALLKSLVALRPALPALGVDESAPVRLVDTVAAAAIMAAKIDEAHWQWVGATHIDEQRFADVYGQWASLVDEENALRNIMPGAGDAPWPAAIDAAAVAEALRKTGLGKLVYVFSGKKKVVRQILERFSLDQSPSEAAKVWDRIAAQASAIGIFNLNPQAASALGPAWQGVETPLDEIDAGLNRRRSILSELGGLPEGDTIASAMIALSHDQLLALAEHEAAASSHQMNAEAFQDVLDDTPIDEAFTLHSDAIASCERLLGLDADRALAGSKLSVAQLAQIDLAHARVVKARAAVERSPFVATIGSLAAGKAEIATLAAAIAWLRAVRGAHLPARLREGLLSMEATRWRDVLRKTANSYSEIEAADRRARGDLEPFALKGLEALDRRSLLAHLDNLLAHRDGLAESLAVAQRRDELEDAGLGDFLRKMEAATLAPSRLPEVFDATVARLRARASRRTSRPLHHLTGIDLDANRKTFAERDRQKILADRKAVQAKLMTNTPPLGERNGPVRMWTQTYLLR
ncbi:MAG: DUF4011 domain-containing protein, partial [Roseiarcus sp.]